VAIAQQKQTIATQAATIQTLQAQNQALADASKHPQFTIWNSCGGPCTMDSLHVRAGSVPDTFDLILSFTSTTPVTIHFLTLTGWTQFSNCSFQIKCVQPSEKADSVGPTTSLKDYTFKLAEGCANYVVVFQASALGTITPDERVLYNPAATPTGACA